MSLQPLCYICITFCQFRQLYEQWRRMELSTLGSQYILKIPTETVTKWKPFASVLEEDMSPWGNKTQHNPIHSPREDTELNSELNHSEFKYIKFPISSNVMSVSHPGKMVWWLRLGVGVNREQKHNPRACNSKRAQSDSETQRQRKNSAGEVFKRKPLLFISTVFSLVLNIF